MKKLAITLFSLLFAVSLVTAQSTKVLVVLADFAGTSDVTDTIINAFNASGYDVTFLTPTDTIPYDTLAQYDVVFWEAGNDGVDSLLWRYTYDDSLGHLVFDSAAFYYSIEKYIQDGKVFWLDGIDIIYDAYGSAPDTFATGSFIHDVMGINIYAAQSKADDGGVGVAYYNKSSTNTITPDVDQVNWKWSTLWYADALVINDNAVSLFEMGGNSDYPLLGYTTCYYYNNFVFTQFRLGAVSSQDLANRLVKDFLDAAANGVFQPQTPTTVEQNGIKISVYPNPADDFVRISAPDLTNAQLTISDISGRIVYRKNLSNSLRVNVSNFAPGVYMISIKSANGLSTMKLIVK